MWETAQEAADAANEVGTAKTGEEAEEAGVALAPVGNLGVATAWRGLRPTSRKHKGRCPARSSRNGRFSSRNGRLSSSRMYSCQLSSREGPSAIALRIGDHTTPAAAVANRTRIGDQTTPAAAVANTSSGGAIRNRTRIGDHATPAAAVANTSSGGRRRTERFSRRQRKSRYGATIMFCFEDIGHPGLIDGGLAVPGVPGWRARATRGCVTKIG